MSSLPVTDEAAYGQHEVDDARGVLAHRLDSNFTGADAGRHEMERLAQLYDIELMNVQQADDIKQALDAVERQLHNAARIVTTLPD